LEERLQRKAKWALVIVFYKVKDPRATIPDLSGKTVQKLSATSIMTAVEMERVIESKLSKGIYPNATFIPV